MTPKTLKAPPEPGLMLLTPICVELLHGGLPIGLFTCAALVEEDALRDQRVTAVLQRDFWPHGLGVLPLRGSGAHRSLANPAELSSQ